MKPLRPNGQCAECGYATGVPGSCHTRCTFDWARNPNMKRPKGDPHGVKNGWYLFPLNYDPVWMDETCPARSEEADPEKVAQVSPLDEILSIMGKRAFGLR